MRKHIIVRHENDWIGVLALADTPLNKENIVKKKDEQYIYLTCIHDRHTDDVFKAFSTEKDAKDYVLTMQIKYCWQDAQENEQYGDWCIIINDDYYMFVQKVELVVITN